VILLAGRRRGDEAAFPCLEAAGRLERNHALWRPLPPQKAGP